MKSLGYKWNFTGSYTLRINCIIKLVNIYILLIAIDNSFLTVSNFTQIQQSCEMIQEWEYGRTFQAILKEVGMYIATFNGK